MAMPRLGSGGTEALRINPLAAALFDNFNPHIFSLREGGSRVSASTRFS